MLRIIFGIGAIGWAAMLIGYWAGYYTPDAVETSLGLIAMTVMLTNGALEK